MDLATVRRCLPPLVVAHRCSSAVGASSLDGGITTNGLLFLAAARATSKG